MAKSLRIAVVGDYNPEFVSHPATTRALHLAAESVGMSVGVDWIATPDVDEEKLAHYNAQWASSGSPYRSFEGALRAIRFARERGKPFVGT